MIHYCSDLHLEFGDVELPGGDLLVLAGDICEARHFGQDFAKQFFFDECAKYNRVLYVYGNHEFYGTRYDKAYRFADYLPHNVEVLQDTTVEHNGVQIFGSTLWTDMHNGNPHTMLVCKHSMNDYKAINIKDGTTYRKLDPRDTWRLHHKSVQALEQTLSNNKPTLVVTHHAPSFKSNDPQYAHEVQLNGAFASDLEPFMLDGQITHWIHGHIHRPVDYQVGGTRVLSNPRGYHGHEQRTFYFSIKEL